MQHLKHKQKVVSTLSVYCSPTLQIKDINALEQKRQQYFEGAFVHAQGGRIYTCVYSYTYLFVYNYAGILYRGTGRLHGWSISPLLKGMLYNGVYFDRV